MTMQESLYHRLGGYDAVGAVVGRLLPRLMADPVLGRFWAHRGADGVAREKQLLIDFLCFGTGGPTHYAGRNNMTSHKGMGISELDWAVFQKHICETLDKFSLPFVEREELMAIIESTKPAIVE